MSAEDTRCPHVPAGLGIWLAACLHLVNIVHAVCHACCPCRCQHARQALSHLLVVHLASSPPSCLPKHVLYITVLL